MSSARELAAALVSPWPTWWVEAPDEATLLRRLAIAGPVPQADLFEPWGPDDRWSARVVMPDAMDRDSGALLLDGDLMSGPPPGMSEWVDRGRVGEDVIEVDGLRAVCRFDLEDGGLLIPDLVYGGVDPELRATLLANVGSRSDQDRVVGARHRPTGRPAVLLEVAVPDRDPDAERTAVIAALAGVAESVPLAPDACWWFDAGRVFALGWRIAPCGPRLPPDAPLTGTLHEHPGPVELHVALPADRHDELAERLGEALGALGWVGARPRWGRVDGKPVFLAAWEGDGERARDTRALLADLPHRVVPGCPAGLEADWLGVDPAWYPADRRTLVRWRCGLRDRDLMPVCGPRDADAFDREVTAELAPLGPCEPVMAGGPALRLELPAMPESAWSVVVRVLGALPMSAIGPVLTVAMRDRTTVLLPRTDLPAPDQPPRFTSLAGG